MGRAKIYKLNVRPWKKPTQNYVFFHEFGQPKSEVHAYKNSLLFQSSLMNQS